MPPTRRQFLVSAALGCTSQLRATEARSPIVDTHLHCFAGAANKRFPYHADAPYRPTAATPPELLLELMAGAGIDFAIVVHPEPYHDDHRYLEHCLNVGKGKLKGTCLFFADRPDTPARLHDLVKRFPAVVAVRIHAYNPGRLPPFGQPELRNLWKLAGDLGLAVQLHFEPRYAPGFEPYINEFRSIRVLVDHLGRPFQGTPAEHAVVVKWAKFDQVVMKLSAVPETSVYPHRDPAPVVAELVKTFGADRLMYGGGFKDGATAKSYRAERERVASLLAGMTATDRAKVLGGTAAKVYGL